ncbi:MAG: hypothetical protein Q4E05_08995 [Pseudoclavibacter sp.]|nr:hypothetical protein [Pseudoclavibacter sp.]
MSGRADAPEETARFYTRSRRFPLMVGRLPEGTRIWGGPYTFGQLGLGVAAFGLAAASRELWSTGGVLTDLLAVIGVGWGAAFLGRSLPSGGMHPVVAAGAAVRALTAPRAGSYRGRPLSPSRPHLVRGGSTAPCGRGATHRALPRALRPRPHGRTAPPEPRCTGAAPAGLRLLAEAAGGAPAHGAAE